MSELSKGFNASLITMGMMGLKRDYAKFPWTTKPFSFIQQAFNEAGLSIPISQLDIYYYVASWLDCSDALNYIKNIAKNFIWTAEKFDCDNRATLVSTLFNVIMDLNCCGQGYVRVFNNTTGKEISYHYCNLLVDQSGKLYVFDIDNGGLSKEVKAGSTFIMGNWRYEFVSARFY